MAGVTTPYLVEQTLVGIATETAYNSAATIGAGAYMYVSKVDAKPESKAVQREHKNGTLSPLADARGDTIWSIELEGEYVTSGSATGVVAPMSALEQAAGMLVSGTNNFIQEHTASTNFPSVGKSATIKVHMRDNLVLLTGVYGNLVETYQAGDIVRWKFSGKGLWQPFSGSQAWPVATSVGERYVLCNPVTASVHAATPEVAKLEFDYGNTIETVLSVGEEYGYSKVIITKRQPVIKFDAVMDAQGTHDFIGRMVAKTQGAFSLTAGSGSGDRLQYTASACQYRSVDIGERNGIYVYNVEANVVGTFIKKVV